METWIAEPIITYWEERVRSPWIPSARLEKPNPVTINKLGKDINSATNKNISKDLIEKLFDIDDIEPTILIESKNKYFIVELIKTENIQKNIENESIKKEVSQDLEKKTKRKLITEIIDKINKNNFSKYDFNKLSKDENVNIEKINLKKQNDDEILKKGIVNQIYAYSENKIIVVNDLNLSENFLIYIDKIENVSINNNSEDYQKYLDLSRIRIINGLYNTYDNYIKKRYKIDINYKALDTVKNYFN